jgi:hypothetical protein
MHFTLEAGKSAVLAYLHLGPAYFYEEGKKLWLFLLEVKVYISCNIEKAAPSDADIFIHNFPYWYKLYGDKFCDSLLFDLLQVTMKHIASKSNSPVGPKEGDELPLYDVCKKPGDWENGFCEPLQGTGIPKY